ncbi:FAF1 [[Candida] subhashii]|uniref:FAF1 n=1 Tax=[Candida] subhashii TaxID=561895 RepID=A0A8J5QSD6_9ASCO|nr:FAF1 [[Candida] subhashii]KAG7661945.1 FAF1 [[Candida] subhashii]
MSVEEEYRKALEIQRRNFEAQFGSIEELGFEDKSKQQSDSPESNSDSPSHDDSSEDDEDDFGGFDSDSDVGNIGPSSDDYSSESEEEEVKPKIIRLNGTDDSAPPPVLSKREKKLLKSGRAPTLTEIEKREAEALKLTKKQQLKAAKEDEENLENDLKLQRLLKESHILANSLQYSGADLTLQTIDYEDPTGKARKRALDSRIRELSSGVTTSKKKLESMPMAMRKGMIKVRQHKIAKYEQEARDAGIVLSKVKKGEMRDLDSGRGSTSASDRLGMGNTKGNNKRMRDRGLKINGIGRSTKHGLIISQREIDKINKIGGSRKKFKKR